jgi:hypothetical protein
MGLVLIYGFILLSPNPPALIGPFSSLKDCYTNMSTYVANLNTSNNIASWQGTCASVKRAPWHAPTTPPVTIGGAAGAAAVSWMTSVQLLTQSTLSK